jgi:hypothetical protein
MRSGAVGSRRSEGELWSSAVRAACDAFASEVDRHRGEPEVHCYRMLGAAEDAEDVVQGTSYAGRDAIARLFAAFSFRPDPPPHLHVPTRANRQPAFAVFLRPTPRAVPQPRALEVLRTEDGSEGEIDVDRLGRDSALFRRRVVELAPEQEVRLDADVWQDAIVFLTAGEVELECEAGFRHRFGRGAIVCLAHLRLSIMRNSGAAPARLLAISRRAACPPTPSGGQFADLPPSHE